MFVIKGNNLMSEFCLWQPFSMLMLISGKQCDGLTLTSFAFCLFPGANQFSQKDHQ